MLPRFALARLSLLLLLLPGSPALRAQADSATPSAPADHAVVTSPDGQIVVTLEATDGKPAYTVHYRGGELLARSRLGLRFAEAPGLDEGFALGEITRHAEQGEWEQPWGERRLVPYAFAEITARFVSEADAQRHFAVRVRAYDDGIGLRYLVGPEAVGPSAQIVDELTEFRVPGDATAWWIEAGLPNRQEYLYRTTPVSEVSRAHTPITMRTVDGVHLSIHEAALIDYAGMYLKQVREGQFEAELFPWHDGIKVRANTPFVSPWRTIQIAPDAPSLIDSSLILNLNEPNKLGDVSDWVKPGKYIGIWWAMHIRDRTWGRDGIHGATTQEAMRYIDFAAEHGFDGVLIEGWNLGWDGDWYHNGDVFSFTEPYPDFDIEAVTRYGHERGVRLIGHHETSGNVSNYEAQLEAAFELYEKLGVAQVKTGYVADAGDIKRIDARGVPRYEWHNGQFMSRHHIRVLESAARHRIAINSHEPIRDTGLRRTYPNWLAREGARGQEYNAWGLPPNPPEHTAILPWTRMLSGPMDFTPGIFELRPNDLPPVDPSMPRPDPRSRIETTLAKQLALYVVLYSPIQMAADLPQHYEARPDAFQFIKDVPTDWEQSITLAGAVGDYIATARRERGGKDWFIGALTDEHARTLSLSLDFLEDGARYTAQIYRDGTDAHWEHNPTALAVESREIRQGEILRLPLAAGGGAAVRLRYQGP
ncbi:MAG: glycoside hydrolase family 97 protein [Pseudomonadota bacterium]